MVIPINKYKLSSL